MTLHPLRLTVILLGVGSLACSSMSGDFETSSLTALIRAADDGAGAAQVTVALRRTDADLFEPEEVTLSDEDRLVAVTADGESEEMAWSDEHLAYAATFSTASRNATYGVAFYREEHESAPDSAMTVPQGIELTTPSQGETYSLSRDDITVQWSNEPAYRETISEPDRDSTSELSDAAIFARLSGDCIETAELEFALDEGHFVVPAGSLEATDEGSDEGDDDADTAGTTGTADTTGTANACEVTIEVFRDRAGTIDPSFASDSSAVGSHVRSVVVQLTP